MNTKEFVLDDNEVFPDCVVLSRKIILNEYREAVTKLSLGDKVLVIQASDGAAAVNGKSGTIVSKEATCGCANSKRFESGLINIKLDKPFYGSKAFGDDVEEIWNIGRSENIKIKVTETKKVSYVIKEQDNGGNLAI